MPDLESPCYVISDVHLGATPQPVDRQLVALLRQFGQDARSIVINGDLFDFWFEWRTVIPRVGFRVLAELANLREQGVEILWIAGNHDCWGGEVLRQDVGVDYYVGAWRGVLAGWQTLIEHGDGLRGKADQRYRAIRPILRHPWAIKAFRWLPADLATRIACGSSHASRTTRARDGGAGLRRVALERLTQSPDVELVIFGHSHVPVLERAPAGGVYANAGSWLDHPNFFRVTPEEIVRYGWSVDEERGLPERHRLNAIQHHAAAPTAIAQEAAPRA